LAGAVVPIVLAIAIGVYVVARQVLPRRVSWLMLVGVPILLVYFGWKQLPAGPVATRQIVDLAGEVALGVCCGLWQAASTRVYVSAGRWYMRGGAPYLLGWVVCLVGDIALVLALEGASGLAHDTWIFLLGAAATWAGRAVGLLVRHPGLLGAPQAAPDA